MLNLIIYKLFNFLNTPATPEPPIKYENNPTIDYEKTFFIVVPILCFIIFILILVIINNKLKQKIKDKESAN